jgi:predicted ester cyclase
VNEQNEALSRRFFEEVCNERRLEVADEIISPDHVFHEPQTPISAPGPQGVKDAVRIYQEGLDGRWDVKDVMSDGDRVVTRWVGHGVHNSELMGIAPTGREIHVDAITIHRIADGRIAEDWTVWDALGLLQQLGVVPSPEAAAAAS